jgi:ribose-phosphate pyrophosphokinase
MKIIEYPDKSSYVKVEPKSSLTYRINSYYDLWILNQTIDALNNLGIIPEVAIPNLIDAQADKRFNINESSGLKLICRFLNGIKVSRYKIFHPHNPEVVEALIDNVEIVDNNDFVQKVLTNIHFDKHRSNCGTLQDTHFDEKISDYLVLMASDAGGFKPLMKLCDKINWKGETMSASKARRFNNVLGKSELIQILNTDNLQGKDILIIDDLCIYGGTFKGLSKLLKEKNCGKLYLAVSHLTVQNLGDDPVTNYFDMVFTTNSKYDNYYVTGKQGEYTPNNLKVIKLFNFE